MDNLPQLTLQAQTPHLQLRPEVLPGKGKGVIVNGMPYSFHQENKTSIDYRCTYYRKSNVKCPATITILNNGTVFFHLPHVIHNADGDIPGTAARLSDIRETELLNFCLNHR